MWEGFNFMQLITVDTSLRLREPRTRFIREEKERERRGYWVGKEVGSGPTGGKNH